MDKAQIYKAFSEQHGIKNQMIKVIEELAELQKELCKYSLYNQEKDSFSILTNICEEIADVEIMLEQLKIILKGIDGSLLPMIGNFKNDKLQRMERGLQEAKECI